MRGLPVLSLWGLARWFAVDFFGLWWVYGYMNLQFIHSFVELYGVASRFVPGPGLDPGPGGENRQSLPS